jgi:hypothetical protein
MRALCEVVGEMESGLYKADLSGGLLKKLASHLLSLSATALITAQNAGELIKVDCDAQDQIGNS